MTAAYMSEHGGPNWHDQLGSACRHVQQVQNRELHSMEYVRQFQLLCF